MEIAGFAGKKLMVSGGRVEVKSKNIMNSLKKISGIFLMLIFCMFSFRCSLYAYQIKYPNVAGSFYPQDPDKLSKMIDGLLKEASPKNIEGEIFVLIQPHAGYGYSGKTAAFGYKSIYGKTYKTVIIIGTSHHYPFSGFSVFQDGFFATPLGRIEVDSDFTKKILLKEKFIFFKPQAFEKEHSLEVQLPFLQKVLGDSLCQEDDKEGDNCGWKIVPIISGDATLKESRRLAELLKEAIGERKDVLVIASTDMYHGYDFKQCEKTDELTISYLKDMDAEGLYYGLREGKLELCGGFGAVVAILLSKSLGHEKLEVLNYTNSAQVTSDFEPGNWTVGYVSCAIDRQSEVVMLNKNQRKRLLEIARDSINTYLKTGKKLEVKEEDPLLNQNLGAFVTLHENQQLRGCIGNIVGRGPLYLTVRDMATEAAVGDPRFAPVKFSEMENIEIEISVLSPLKEVRSADEIELGKHGVLVRNGFNSGVFLPQVATETGWTKDEFMNYLCMHKAGLPQNAWKDGSCDIFVFTAEVFSEKK